MPSGSSISGPYPIFGPDVPSAGWAVYSASTEPARLTATPAAAARPTNWRLDRELDWSSDTGGLLASGTSGGRQ